MALVTDVTIACVADAVLTSEPFSHLPSAAVCLLVGLFFYSDSITTLTRCYMRLFCWLQSCCMSRSERLRSLLAEANEPLLGRLERVEAPRGPYRVLSRTRSLEGPRL